MGGIFPNADILPKHQGYCSQRLTTNIVHHIEGEESPAKNKLIAESDFHAQYLFTLNRLVYQV